MRKNKWIAVAGGLLLAVSAASMAKADHIGEYYPTKTVKLAAGQSKVVELKCEAGDHLMSRGGSYVLKKDGSPRYFVNDTMQQIPLTTQCNGAESIMGLDFGLHNGTAEAQEVRVWIICLSDNNS